MGFNIDLKMISIAVVIALIIGTGAGYMVGNSPVSSLMEERDQLEVEYDSSYLAVQSLEAELDSVQELLVEEQRENRHLMEEYSEMFLIDQENQELNQQVIDLESEITGLQNAYQYLFDEYEELHDYYVELEENYTVLQADFVEINQSYASLLSARAEEYSALEQQINELQSQVNSLEDELEQARTEEPEPEPEPEPETFVGSVNSDVYHYTWCSYADRINAENKRYFSSSQAARAAGYRPCKVCKPP